MEDFYYAGGLRARARSAARSAHTDCLTVAARTLGERSTARVVCNDEVIAPREAPIGPKAASRCCAAISRPTAR